MSQFHPPAAFSFSATLEGEAGPVEVFQEVSGLDREWEVTEVREGGENRFEHQLPGSVKAQNLVLKRGFLNGQGAFFGWIKDTLETDFSEPIVPKTVTVALLDSKGQGLIRWTVARAWPVKWAIGDVTAQEDKVHVETLELAFAEIKRQQVDQIPPV